RIVIDKSAKADTAEAQRAAAEQIAQARVEREHQIEATHERAEPLHEAGETVELEPERVAEPAEGGRRRGRRGRRRGRSRDTGELPVDETFAGRPAREQIDTPFVAADPSIQRIIDDEEIASAPGEMFKDARLQERIFDHIHAVEFNLEDDFRTAEVGSVLPAGGYSDPAFQRVDDSDVLIEGTGQARPTQVAARVESFVDEPDADMLRRGLFERVSDEDEGTPPETEVVPGRRSKKQTETTREAAASKKKRASKKAATKTAQKRAAKKPTKRRTSKDVTGQLELSDSEPAETLEEDYDDAEASVTAGYSRAEFATRRGGRRRRRSSKQSRGDATASSGNGKDEEADHIGDQAEASEASPPAANTHPAPRERGHNGRGSRGFQRKDRHQPAITDLLREGQEILVQIAKEPIAKKGARITSHIALPGRFLVYMPTVEHVGVSRKIESDSERQRLRKLIQQLRADESVPSGGFIVRTAGTGVSERELREDVRYLVRTWLDIRAAAEKAKPASLVHRDLDLVQRILRDQLSDDFAAIRVDSEDEYERIVEFINRIQPRMVKRVKLYTREQPILEAFGVQSEIDKAIKPRVWLRSGGYLVINQTEALVAIDVNTGKFVGRGSGRLEDTITRTNLEAVEEIVRQIRLRDLGGIIVLDLIDMEERRNRTKVMQALQESLRDDKSPTKVLSFNDFGLVIMTRKRVKQSLERTLCAPCQYCQGAGLIKSPQTICYELLEEARRLSRTTNGDKSKQTTLRIHPEVARVLRGSERDVLNEIEEYLGPVDVNSDSTIHQEQFDFAFV
ncbi:MAG TPA: Rne/Rng family ribonuclease, partial [Pyrinomonadaceae bacterium]|nr:Rne/Rng family ribonuclease [Pyrinomonadaceae bacterium]